MHYRSGTSYPESDYSIVPPEKRDPAWALRQIQARTDLEVKTGVARLRKNSAVRERTERADKLIGLWPVWGGGLIACFAPVLYGAVEPLGLWGVRVLFPLVALAGYHDLHLGAALSGDLPQVLLYAQFPVEGMLARMALRGRVTIAGVAGQLLLFHLLAAVGLWLLRGGLSQVTLH